LKNEQTFLFSLLSTQGKLGKLFSGVNQYATPRPFKEKPRMKTEFKAKFLNHMSQRKKGDKGFTLIELLVVIIIIGILAAIALPAFLNQANKAKQAEAKTNVGSMNRAQQAYRLEKDKWVDGTNPTSFANLGLGIATQTSNYQYKISGGEKDEFISNFGDPAPLNPKASVKAYVGGVKVGTVQNTGEATTLVALCEAKQPLIANGPGVGPVALGAQGDPPDCPANFDAIK
jgi:type IV pilus assembly protein PilA